MLHALVDELLKLGAVSDEHAQKALDRLDTLDRNRPTLKQVGRYGTIGALAGPAIGAIGNIIEKKPAFGGLRSIASQAVKGSLSAGAIPLVRTHFDRQGEIGTLKKYVAEREPGALQKTSKSRGVKEWRIAQNSGREADADNIAKGYGRLGLAPRHVEDVSGGGMEASVDKMIGRASGPERNESGYIARKLYKPDSPITIGKDTSKLLSQKQEYTDAARALSPEARGMVPAMYGHKTLEGPGGQLRHVSEHEFVPGSKSMRRSPDAFGQVSRFQKAVTDPMAARGMPLSDITRVKGPLLSGNFGNLASTPEGPKLLDFLPAGKDSPISFAGEDSVRATSGRNATGYGRGEMKELRKEVFRPRANYEPGVTPVGNQVAQAARVIGGPDKTHVGGLAAPIAYRPTQAPPSLSRAAATVRPGAVAATVRPGALAGGELGAVLRRSSLPTKMTQVAGKARGLLQRIPQLGSVHI